MTQPNVTTAALFLGGCMVQVQVKPGHSFPNEVFDDKFALRCSMTSLYRLRSGIAFQMPRAQRFQHGPPTHGDPHGAVGGVSQ